MAILASRVSFDFDSTYKTKKELVGSYMAHVDYYSPVDRNIYISYPSDPVVSEAPRDLLRTKWESVISSISSSIRSRVINVGALGELAAQITCIFAMDQALEMTMVDCPPTVEQFLRCISGGLFEMEAETEDVTLAKGLLNFNHFIEVKGYSVNRGDLVSFIKRRAAVVCKRNTRGVDLIIPVVLNKSYGSVVEPHDSFEHPQKDTRNDSMVLDVPNLVTISQKASQKENDDFESEMKRLSKRPKYNNSKFPVKNSENLTEYDLRQRVNERVISIAEGSFMDWGENLARIAPVSGALFIKTPPAGTMADLPRAVSIPSLNIEQSTLVPKPQTRPSSLPLSPHEESLYPLDSRCISYILIQVKNLESYSNSYYQSRKKYCFCNPLGCGLESETEVQDKRPYAALAIIFDRNRLEGPIVYNMDNTFIPEKESEVKAFPEPVLQDHAFAKVLVNPQ